MSSDKLRSILGSFDTTLFQDEVSKAQKLLECEGVIIEGPSKGGQTKFLKNYFERQSQTQRAESYSHTQFTNAASTANSFPNERWREFCLSKGSAVFLVFVNEQDVGRVCLNLSADIREDARTPTRRESKTRYVRAAWKHDYPDEPVMYYFEIDEQRWEVRRIEVYRDGHRRYASATEEPSEAQLGEDPLPELDEIAKDSQFEPAEITRDEFEAEWSRKAN